MAGCANIYQIQYECKVTNIYFTEHTAKHNTKQIAKMDGEEKKNII